MDEELQYIDNVFEQAVENHVDLPDDHVWNNLETALQKRKVAIVMKKYKRWKWAATGLLLFLIVAVIYNVGLTWKYKVAIKASAPASATAYNNTHKSVPDSIEKLHPTAAKLVTAKTDSGNVGSKVVASKQQHSVHEKTVVTENAEVNSALTPAKIDEIKIAKVKKQESYTGSLLTRLPNSNGKVITLDSEILKDDITSIKAKRRRAKPNDKVTRQKSGIIVISGDNIMSNPLSTSSPQNASFIELPEFSEISLHSSLAIATVSLLTKPTITPYPLEMSTAVMGISSATTIRLISKKVHPGNLIAGVFYSRNNVSTILKTNRPDYREDNYLQIKNHEKNRTSSVFGFSLETFLGHNLTIGSGVGLSNFTTDITTKSLVARWDNNGKINYRISTSSGYAYYSVTARPQPAIADSIKTLSAKSIVKYVTVPFSLRYHFYAGNFALIPTLSLNANFKTMGNITTVQSLEHTYSGDIVGLKSHYFDGNVGVGLGYFLNKRIEISLFPSARLALSNAIEINPVTAKRNAFGIAGTLHVSF